MTRLAIGQDIPVRRVETAAGLAVLLTASTPIWLAFFRYATCPLCNLRVHQLALGFDQFTRRGVHLVAVFQSPRERLSGLFGGRPLPFDVVCDPDLDLYRAWGVETSVVGSAHPGAIAAAVKAAAGGHAFGGVVDGPARRVPADFVLRDGVVRGVHYGRHIGDHITDNDVHRLLDDLGRDVGRRPAG